MRLEERRELLAFIEFADGQRTLPQFGRVVCVVGQEGTFGCAYLEVEPTFHAAVACHAVAEFLVGGSVELC